MTRQANEPSTKPRLNRKLGLVAGALLAGLTSNGHSASAQSDTDYARMFFNAGYGYCDARKLSKVLRVSVYRAKVLAGRKIASGNTGLLQQQWQRGVRFFQRYGFSCRSGNLQDDSSRYAYSDSQKIADIWKG